MDPIQEVPPQRKYFTTADWVTRLRELPPEGAVLKGSSLRLWAGLDEKAGRQACWRLAKSGILTHLGDGWYTHAFAQPAIEEIGHLLVIPSYASLETVLAWRGVTTERAAIHTCVTTQPRQVRTTPLGGIHYHQLARPLFFGFERRRGPSGISWFEAHPEKALLDLLYLGGRGRRGAVWFDLDFTRLDPIRLDQYAERFPAATRRRLDDLRKRP